MCLYICCRSFNAKNMIFKESLVWTERDTGGEWDMNTSQIHLSVFYWISTLSCDSWVPVSFHPHSEHREERRWPQLYVPSPTGTSQSIRLLFFCFFVFLFWMKCDVVREPWSVTNYFSYPYFLLSSMSIIFSILSLHCILTWVQVFIWDQSVHLSLYTRLSLPLSLSVCSKPTAKAEWRTSIFFFFLHAVN